MCSCPSPFISDGSPRRPRCSPPELTDALGLRTGQLPDAMTPFLIVIVVLVLIALGVGGFGTSWGRAIGDAWSGRPRVRSWIETTGGRGSRRCAGCEQESARAAARRPRVPQPDPSSTPLREPSKRNDPAGSTSTHFADRRWRRTRRAVEGSGPLGHSHHGHALHAPDGADAANAARVMDGQLIAQS